MRKQTTKRINAKNSIAAIKDILEFSSEFLKAFNTLWSMIETKLDSHSIQARKRFSFLLWILCLQKLDLNNKPIEYIIELPKDGYSLWCTLTKPEQDEIRLWFRARKLEHILDRGLEEMEKDFSDTKLFKTKWTFMHI